MINLMTNLQTQNTKQNPAFTSKFDRKAIKIVKMIYNDYVLHDYDATQIRETLMDGLDNVLIGATRKKVWVHKPTEKNIFKKLLNFAKDSKSKIQSAMDPKIRLKNTKEVQFYAYYKGNEKAKLDLFKFYSDSSRVGNEWAIDFSSRLKSSEGSRKGGQFKEVLDKIVESTNKSIEFKKEQKEALKRTQKNLSNILSGK